MKPELIFLGGAGYWPYFGNDKDLTIDINNHLVLGIRNKSINPISITVIPKS
ncbi:hypothetical protein [Spiroplasma phoeniceum]|uniref:Uncharacterized protein n=1 Tax=Spiroplasma phoeniceum P40 TaxID=1276259 RepID=A0A345DS69_9MOLU|nr:hypothetical protein [Spiroplasma phoeniceum]AXF97023.1 hypothetical protein SDAV_002090 [Spiroplasma phoeniceum P40]AXF97060.1 hypothetical protein SDAV_002127 [Spiroplasma phoeniceum P40]